MCSNGLALYTETGDDDYHNQRDYLKRNGVRSMMGNGGTRHSQEYDNQAAETSSQTGSLHRPRLSITLYTNGATEVIRPFIHSRIYMVHLQGDHTEALRSDTF